MTDDGGLLLNFDLSADHLSSYAKPPAIAGGRWKERFRAKKQAQYKQRKANAVSDPSSVRPRQDNVSQASNTESYDKPYANTPRTNLKRKRDDAAARNPAETTTRPNPTQQVISSLFSGNPTSTTIETNDNAAALQVDATPSNAPLADGSPFTSLGLSDTLANHLTTKLKLKHPTAIQQTAVPQLIDSDSDAFIQAETGSGKTLTYLLPVVQRILSASSSTTKLHRDSGCFAIVLAPTRELGRQIHLVLTQLLSHPSLHWMVPILLLGGENKKSEKGRLRKGGNIVVATPGRLADHLENTKSFDVGNVRWIIMDEGDRLMELGFEETIKKILDTLANRSRIGRGFSRIESYGKIPERMITMLCSATIKGNVQKLGDISLKEALFIKAEKSGEDDKGDDNDAFKAPAQLRQSYIVAPAKLRLVSLAAVLKRAFVRRKEGVKVVVFFSCADSVDFHFKVFTRNMDNDDDKENSTKDTAKLFEFDESNDIPAEEKEAKIEDKPDPPKKPAFKNPATAPAPLLDPCITLFKLHGSLTQPIRTATINAFSHNKQAAVLFCTDVASRGLDLPNVDLVIQFDPPFSHEDYLHRIGRTARAGREGRAMIFLLPGSEEDYPLQVLKGASLVRTDSTEVLKKGFDTSTSTSESKMVAKKKGGRPGNKDDFLPYISGASWEEAATEYHLDIERWVLSSPKHQEAARRAFQSHIRAYATHVAAERQVFDIKQLHLGHLAKAFGLRDRPGSIKVPGRGGNAGDEKTTSNKVGKERRGKGEESTAGGRGGDGDDSDAMERVQKRKVLPQNAEMQGTESSKRMRLKIREHMNAISEFNIG